MNNRVEMLESDLENLKNISRGLDEEYSKVQKAYCLFFSYGTSKVKTDTYDAFYTKLNCINNLIGKLRELVNLLCWANEK